MRSSPFTPSIISVICLLYLFAMLLLWRFVGPWTAMRHGLINGLIVFAWLWGVHSILDDMPVPRLPPIRYPAGELVCSLIIVGGAIAIAANHFAGWVTLVDWLFPLVTYGGVFALFIAVRYPLHSLGLHAPTHRGWWAALAVIAINLAAVLLFQLVPRDTPLGGDAGDLAEQITGPLAALLLIVGLLFRAALPEELMLRVMLQPRLAHFLPLGWAILMQALLFNAAHLP
jgi:membrane protease YdiL (CAAX protease family)